MIKKLFKMYIICTIMFILIAYPACILLSGELNPLKWEIELRGSISVIYASITSLVVIQFIFSEYFN